MTESAPPQNPIAHFTGLAAGGSCVGDILSPETEAGKKAFVPYVVPGEEAEITLTKSKKSFAFGELVQLKTRSPHRIEAPCPHFFACGGCDLQHIELSHQRELKRSMVEDALRVQGNIVPVNGVTLMGRDLAGFGYRRRMSFHVNKKLEFGLYKKNGRQIVQLTHCPISTDPINRCLEENLQLFKECAPEADTITLEDHDGDVFAMIEMHPRAGERIPTLLAKPAFEKLEERLHYVAVSYRHKTVHRSKGTLDAPPIGHFSQNNKEANSLMLAEILAAAEGTHVTDLYAGAGNISLPLAAEGKIVTAVEVDPHLVEFGRRKAEASGFNDRLTFHTMSCEKWIEKNVPFQTVVLDPPRGGAVEVAQRLDPAVSPTVVYVSCYPPTFVRDSQELLSRGYTLDYVKVLDMFPQTYHAEVVALFRGP